jgi:hypothetical protein
MASIYESSYLTVAAGASSDDDGGFFSLASDSYAKSQCSSLKLGRKLCNIYVRYCIDHPDAEFPAKEVLPLMRRGWCFQERLLSRRYLCFGSKELLWECMEDVACSCSVAYGPFNPRHYDMVPRFRGCSGTKILMTIHEKKIPTCLAKLSIRICYARIGLSKRQASCISRTCELFPGMPFLHPCHILLDKHIQQTFETGPYVHGLWVSSLKEDPSWSIWRHSASVGRPRESPSWSWVSCVESRLDWTDFHESDCLHLREIVQRPENPMLAPLSVSGILLTLSIQTRPKETELEEKLSWVRRCQILKLCDTVVFESSHSAHPDDFEDRGVNKVGPGLLQSLTADLRADYRFRSSGEDLRVMLQHMVFCVLGVENRGRLDDVEPCWVAGMILRPIEDQGCFPEGSELQQFERIGWLRYCTDVMRSEFEPTGTKSHFLIV